MAYVGGAITLPGQAYKILVGVVLLYAAWQLWLSGRAGDEMRELREPPLGWAMLIGAAMGLLAGLTGVGGGIFLSPLLLMLGWAGTKQTSAVAAPFILVNSIAGLAAVAWRKALRCRPTYGFSRWRCSSAAGSAPSTAAGASPIRSCAACSPVVLALAGAKMISV